jgi:hypothetical protein
MASAVDLQAQGRDALLLGKLVADHSLLVRFAEARGSAVWKIEARSGSLQLHFF